MGWWPDLGFGPFSGAVLVAGRVLVSKEWLSSKQQTARRAGSFFSWLFNVTPPESPDVLLELTVVIREHKPQGCPSIRCRFVIKSLFLGGSRQKGKDFHEPLQDSNRSNWLSISPWFLQHGCGPCCCFYWLLLQLFSPHLFRQNVWLGASSKDTSDKMAGEFRMRVKTWVFCSCCC